MTHEHLAYLWCKWNGQVGNINQVVRVMQRLSADDLARMLLARGVRVS